ncbi:MAG: ATP-binding protein [Roseovarius sp.]
MRGRFNRQLVSKIYLLLAVVAFLSAVGIGYTIITSDYEQYTRATRADVERELDTATGQLRNWFFEFELVANRIESFLAVSPQAPMPEISHVVEDLLEHNPQVFAVALAPGLKITQSYPETGNRKSIGLNYWEMPEQMPGVARAFRDRAPVLDGPVALVQGGQGYLLRYPVLIPRTGRQIDKFWGIVSVGISAESLFGARTTGGEAEAAAYSFGLRELYPDGRVRHHLHGDPALFEGDAVIREMNMLGSRWLVAAEPRDGWPRYSPQSPMLIAFTLIGAVALLIVLLSLRQVTVRGERAHALLREAIDCIDEGFVAFDENDRLVSVNQKFVDYHPKIADLMRPGLPFETMIREGVKRGQFPEAEGCEAAWVAQRLARFREPGTPFQQRLPGDRWLKVTDARTPHGYTVGVKTDVTAEKRALAAAEAMDREKTEFLNNVSHELRTPLTVISGRAAFLRHEGMPQTRGLMTALSAKERDAAEIAGAVEEYRLYVEEQSGRVLTSSQHMLRLVEDLLDWTRVERGQLELDKGPVQVVDVAKGVVDDLRSEAEAKGLMLTYRSTGAAEVLADRIRLTQVLYNLVSNAIKFTEAGRILLSVEVAPEAVYFSVEDTGRGIAAGDLERIFDRFRQVDGSATRQRGGLGLGLAIARKLAELHDGSLSVKSVPGEGSVFRLSLPRAAEAEMRAPCSA